MKYQLKLVAALCAFASVLAACNAPETETVPESQKYESTCFERPDIRISEIDLPKGYVRDEVEKGSFADYLQSLYLRPQGAKLRSCIGEIFEDQSSVSAVLFHAVPISGTVNAADVPVFLYAEYMYKSGELDKLSFSLPGGFEAKYSAWRDGERFKADGAMPVEAANVPADSSVTAFFQYLDKVFTFTSASAIADMFSKVEADDVRAGDVAVAADGAVYTVADVAVKGSKKALVFIEGCDPASEMFVAASVGKKGSTPWHACKRGSYDIGECVFYRIEK